MGMALIRPFPVVREHAEFRKLWLGNLISMGGSSLTRLALPLAAAVTLQASPSQMGVLAAAGTLPNLLLGLPAGVLVDWLPRRPILVVADASQASLLASIPIAAVLGLLRMEQLYLVSFLAAALDLLSDVAAISIVPVVLGRERLADGNTLLNLNGQVAKLAGPPAAGVLIGILTAPIVIALDAISFLVSAACMAAVRVSEPTANRATSRGWWTEIREGLALVWRDQSLRTSVGSSILGTLAGAVRAPLLILFLVRELDLSPQTIGVVLGVGGIAAFPGGLLARPAAERLGEGRALATGTSLTAIGMLLVPLAGGPAPVALATLVLTQLLIGVGAPIYSINQLTLRQTAAPNNLQGRINATRRFLMFGAAPLGAIASGYAAQAIGLRPALAAGALLMALALLWTVRSPLWSARDTAASEAVTVSG